MPKEHSWKVIDADGARREVRAVRHAAKWRIQSRTSVCDNWCYHEQPLLADLEYLRELIQRKYQRRRASWDELKEVEQLVKDARRAVLTQ